MRSGGEVRLGLSTEEEFMVGGQLGMRDGGAGEGSGATFYDLLRDAERGVMRMTRGLPDVVGQGEGDDE